MPATTDTQHHFVFGDAALDAACLDRLLEISDQTETIRQRLAELVLETANELDCDVEGALARLRRELDILSSDTRASSS